MEDRDEFAPSPEKMPPSFAPLTERERKNADDIRHAEASKSSDEEEDEEQRVTWWRTILEFGGVIVAALVISVIIKTFLVQAFYVPSGSMETTLQQGDRIAVSRLNRGADDIHRGDVVVFVDPGGWLDPQPEEPNKFKAFLSEALQAVGLLPQNTGQHLVKRVIGVGGDTVECKEVGGKITVNGVEIDETYLDPGVVPSNSTFSVTVPEGYLWLMGDNRAHSKDSRYHQEATGNGFVPVGNVTGKVWAIFYPFSHFGTLPDGNAPFSDVP